MRIGRYGNGFKSSSMRLGADALVLSASKESGGPGPHTLTLTLAPALNPSPRPNPNQESGGLVAGLLSYTLLNSNPTLTLSLAQTPTPTPTLTLTRYTFLRETGASDVVVPIAEL